MKLPPHWKSWISPLLLALVLLAGVWYYRPVSIDGLCPGLEPSTVSVHVRCTSGTQAQPEREGRIQAAADAPEGRAVLERLEELSFRRPPTNLLYHILSPTATGYQVQEGDYRFTIHLYGESGQVLSLAYSNGRWSYTTPGHGSFLPCHMKDGAAKGQALGAELLELSEDLHS